MTSAQFHGHRIGVLMNTEEVLPTIRKTGKHDAGQSSNSKKRINRMIYLIQHL